MVAKFQETVRRERRSSSSHGVTEHERNRRECRCKFVQHFLDGVASMVERHWASVMRHRTVCMAVVSIKRALRQTLAMMFSTGNLLMRNMAEREHIVQANDST